MSLGVKVLRLRLEFRVQVRVSVPLGLQVWERSPRFGVTPTIGDRNVGMSPRGRLSSLGQNGLH